MKKHIQYFLLLPGIFACLFIACTCNSHTCAIQFDKLIYDFGTTLPQQDIHFAFEFTNTGTRLLVIENVQPECGCTTTKDWDKEILPGEKGRIPVTFTAPYFAGEVNEIINVSTNVPGKKLIRLRFKGRAVISVQPAPL